MGQKWMSNMKSAWIIPESVKGKKTVVYKIIHQKSAHI